MIGINGKNEKIVEHLKEVLEELKNEEKIEEQAETVFQNCVVRLIKPLLDYVIENIDFQQQNKIEKQVDNILEKLKEILEKQEGPWEKIYREIKHIRQKKEVQKDSKKAEIIEEELVDIIKLLGSLENNLDSLCSKPDEKRIENVKAAVNKIKKDFLIIIDETKSIESDIEHAA